MNQSEFDDLTRSFIGLELSRLWRGHGTTLFAEVGPLSRTYSRSGRPKADRSLDFSWCWRVESQRSILFGSFSSDRRIKHGIASLQGLFIEGISVCGRLPELRVQLSGGRWVSTFATQESQPDWTVFLPDASYLTVRRGTVIRADPSQQISQMTAIAPEKRKRKDLGCNESATGRRFFRG